MSGTLLKTVQVPFEWELTFFASHRKDLPFEITEKNAPSSLVDNEGSLASKSGVCVRLGDNPGWCIRNTL